MITVKGVRYFNDNHMPTFELQFENLGQFMNFIQKDTLGKKRITIPKVEKPGEIDRYGSSFEWADEYRSNDGDVQKWVYLITENGKILFSNGKLTDGRAHVSTAMKEMFDNLKAWQNEEYEFAD